MYTKKKKKKSISYYYSLSPHRGLLCVLWQPRMTSVEDPKYRLETSFRGRNVSIMQIPRERLDNDIDNTGWAAWECSNVLLRFLADDSNIAQQLLPPQTAPFSELRFLDLSSGAGLVSCALAAGGARVTASDVPAQLEQLAANVQRLSQEDAGRVVIASYLWGEPLDGLRRNSAAPPLTPPSERHLDHDTHWFDVVCASDVLYIAIRDKRTAALRQTLVCLKERCRCMLFAFEERLVDEEQAFMEELGLEPRAAAASSEGAAASSERASVSSAPPPFRVVELGRDLCTIPSYDDSLKGAGGLPDTDLWNPSLFWTAPPVRMFVLC